MALAGNCCTQLSPFGCRGFLIGCQRSSSEDLLGVQLQLVRILLYPYVPLCFFHFTAQATDRQKEKQRCCRPRRPGRPPLQGRQPVPPAAPGGWGRRGVTSRCPIPQPFGCRAARLSLRAPAGRGLAPRAGCAALSSPGPATSATDLPKARVRPCQTPTRRTP